MMAAYKPCAPEKSQDNRGSTGPYALEGKGNGGKAWTRLGGGP